MGNIMICGSLCDSCEIADNQANLNQTSYDRQIEAEKLLIKEIIEREKMQKLIKEEISKLKDNISNGIKDYCKNVKSDIEKKFDKLDNHNDKIENSIKKNEYEIGIIKTKIDNITITTNNIRVTLDTMNNKVIENTTKIGIL